MGKTTRYNCAYLDVTVSRPWPLAGSDNEKKRQDRWVEIATKLLTQIIRHCDDVEHVEIKHDTDDLCEHCGAAWTEGDSSHNGGCCDKDCDVMEAEDAVEGVG